MEHGAERSRCMARHIMSHEWLLQLQEILHMNTSVFACSCQVALLQILCVRGFDRLSHESVPTASLALIPHG